MNKFKLSICIATFNRATYIGETLNSILSQLDSNVELIVVDGASPDSTGEVMRDYANRYPQVRYFKEQENSGVDRDYDKAVGYASGEYCWLMTDDDLLLPGSVATVLSKLTGQWDLVVVNSKIKNADLSKTLASRQLDLEDDRVYSGNRSEQFCSDCMRYLSFIGSVVIRRDAWLSRDRVSYYGTLFVHVGVIFQEKALENVYVIAAPQIVIRYGNAMWTSKGFEIWMFKWPQLVWSFDRFSDETKKLVCKKEPYTELRELVLKRAIGVYGLKEYRQFLAGQVFGLAKLQALGIALTPACFVNTLASLYCIAFNRKALSGIYDFSRSTNSTVISRMVARIMNV
ncbi:glycosyltransferase family 2 protein [Candidatus Aalborgicola defluviihabitans]|uniref:glycosyltransferase family 2 protein n=1 Tax=Candidatus Aalborgicola defluviihabitans TaxID=3386187 RepID=UPI001D39F60B|nr:glycosyltransferase family 2 protein [Burkholderiales bacterium]